MAETAMSKLVSVPKRTLPLPELLVQRLIDTPQNPRYHAEGNVYNHTQLVLDQYFQYAEKNTLSKSEQVIYYWAAVLHDLGKIEVTRWEWGRWRATGHEEAGVSIARDILIGRPEVSAKERYAILQLVRWHHIPLRWGLQQKSLNDYILLGTEVDLRRVGLFGSFDLKGRICEDKGDVLHLCEQFQQQIVPKVMKVLGPFQELQDRYSTLDHRQQDALWTAFSNREPALLQQVLRIKLEKRDKKVLQCVMTIGTPRAGKSYHIEQKYPHYHRLNSDLLNLARASTINIHQFQQEISAQLEKQSSVVIDGTNLNIDLRQQIATHVRKEGAHLKYIFFERSLSQIKVQNRLSSTPLEESKILEAYKQLHIPHPWEANQLEIV